MSERAEEIFADALDVHRSERDVFVEAACGGDGELRGEVEALLRDAEKADTFFEALSRGAPGVPGQTNSASRDKPGTLIGPYLLVRPLGRGGFGSVWLASQTLPLRRQVALKLIKRGMDSEDVLARFRAEQQALAMMNHPNIARVFDAGVAPDGRPFFAMELVEGEKITAFCDARSLPISERLRLFLQVCSAVMHAHQKGIIHRDLKPSNILVTGKDIEPVVKVIDFGIARAIEGSLTGDRTLTQAGQFVGTPSYMSPEQAGGRSDAIDTRTDIYSLGIILYELLAGAVPFDEKTLAAAGREEICRIIREEEPARPSTKLCNLSPEELTGVASARKLSAEALSRLVKDELDWIAMKAIDKSKDRRYETTAALAGDVQRFLDNEPVSARPPSTAYLLGKMVRRHRGLIGAAALIAVVLVAATATSLWLAFRAAQAEALAAERLTQVLEEQKSSEKARQDAEAVSNFIVDLFRKPDPEKGGRDVKVADVLKGAEKDIAEKLADQPERALLLKRTLADTYEGLGLYPEAAKLRKEIYEEGNVLAPETSAESIDDLSRLAQLQFQRGFYEEALDYFRREVKLREAQSVQDPEKFRKAREGLITCLHRTGNREKSRELREALNVEKTGTPGPSKRTPTDRPSAPKTPEEAEARRVQEFERLKQQLDELMATRPRLDSELLNRMDAASRRFFRLNEGPSTMETQRELVARMHEKYGPDHMATIESEERLHFYFTRISGPRDTFERHRKLRERKARLFGPERLESLNEEISIGALMNAWGRHDEAIQTLERVVPLMQKVGVNDRRAAHAEAHLGQSYLAVGRTSEGMALLDKAVPRMLDDSYVSMFYANMLLWLGREDDYRKLRESIMQWAWSFKDQMGRNAHIASNHMATFCLLPPDRDEDREKVSEIIRLAKRQDDLVKTPSNTPTQWRQFFYGLVAYRLGDYEEARKHLEWLRLATPEMRSTWGGSRSIEVANDIYLAMTMAAQGDPSAAELYEAARAKVSEPISPDEPTAKSGATGKHLYDVLAKREADKILKPTEPATSQP